MQLRGPDILLSASDLVDACSCSFLPGLALAQARGVLAADLTQSPEQELVARQGAAHEQSCLEHLRREGKQIVAIREAPIDQAASETLRAMAEGTEVIYQGALLSPPWMGRTDFLIRVTESSDLGAFSYQVLDAKLARQARGRALVQAALYTLLLERAQGVLPEQFHLYLGTNQIRSFRAGDYTAYTRLAQRRLETEVRAAVDGVPDLVPACPTCRFLAHCDGLRREVDHLSLLPGIQRRQIARLRQHGVATVADLAQPKHIPALGTNPALQRLARLAELRVRERSTGQPSFDLRGTEPGRGLSRLPAPSPGDLYFDLEGDPFAAEGSLEYLWGWLTPAQDGAAYGCQWAHSPPEERLAFERFIDLVSERRRQWPDMHVYHYAAYEPTALKRLMGRYGTRETAVDQLLRGQVFVDLYRVAYESIDVSAESYSLKALEPFYLPSHRQAEVRTAAGSVVAYDLWKTSLDGGILADIQRYNEEDCRSTAALHGWMEELRQRTGITDRPVVTDGTPSVKVLARDAHLADLAAALAGGPLAEEPARALLGGLLFWYRREQRPQWWSYFSRLDAGLEDLAEDPDCIYGLELEDNDRPEWTFSFDAGQQYTLRPGDRPRDARTGRTVGEIISLDPIRGELTLRSKADLSDLEALIPGPPIDTTQQEGALGRLARVVARDGFAPHGPYRHLRDLLAGSLPRFQGVPLGTRLQSPDDDPATVGRRLVLALDESTLAVQGPPGTGKTTLAGSLVAQLLMAGRRVGVTAQSHKVIGNLLHSVDRALLAEGVTVQGVQRAPDGEGVPLPWVSQARDLGGVLTALSNGALLVAGTAWLFAREGMDSLLDVLVVDEAGQYALADAIASGTAARNLILVGDPQQLRQVVQGSHPPGVAVSALEHVLAGQPTMPPGRGLFLPVTHRLHPDIAAFVSETSYEGRLRSGPVCALRRLSGPVSWATAHLRYLPVPHVGNRRTSPEEVTAVVKTVTDLLKCSLHDGTGRSRPLTLEDLLVVAPFNAHVQRLATALGPGARVGTVDRFQGQEAPVVIYATAASDSDHIPHGMEFLFSLNRLNVAISRAQVLAIMVGSSDLLRTWSEDPENLRLVNALCRFVLDAEAWASSRH